VDLYVFGPPESNLFTSKQGVFRWNDLLRSFEEGDAKGVPEIRTGDLQIKKLALNL
jgi:hypothetical protein